MNSRLSIKEFFKKHLAKSAAVLLFAAAFAMALATEAEAQSARTPPRNRQNAQAQAAAMTREDLKNVPRGTNGVPALAFNQADVSLVLEAYADEVGKTVIPAPDLPKAQITLRSLEGQVLTKEEYLQAIELVLTMNGVVLEPRGSKFIRALPRKTVRTHGIPVSMEDNGNLPENGRVVSQMIQFKNIEVNEAQKALEGFKAPEGLFQVFERTNAILVTDMQENINRMLEIARVIDVATPVTEEVFVRQIEYATATDIKEHLDAIVEESQKDNQQKQSGPKSSGAPGFGSTTPAGRPSLLNRLRDRRQEQTPAPANNPNANLVAAVSDSDRGMIRGKVLIRADERSNKIIVITNKSNMDFFDRVIKTLDVETTPEVQIEVIRLKYAEAEDVEQMLNELIGASNTSSQSKNNQNANTAKGGTANSNLTRGTTQNTRRTSTGSPTFQNSNASRLGELSKDNVKVLADKRINGIVVMARRADMRAIRDVIDNMDVKLSQVLIETVIIEISLGDDFKFGMDWVQRGKYTVQEQVQKTDQYGRKLFWNDLGAETTTDTGVPVYTTVTKTIRDNFFNNGGKNAGYMLGGGGGSGSSALGGLMQSAASVATNDSSIVAANPIGGGINYFLKSDKLNLAAVINASKTDTRSKYVASPIIMTLDNKEATIEATKSSQFLTGWSAVSSSYAGSGLPSPNYTAKEIGITLKVTPKINPNGTVMLKVEEEYSQVSEKQTMLTPQGQTYVQQVIDVPVTRKMSADISLENGESVVLGGLVQKSTNESETGIPFLKDIPWIGKWLFSSVEQTEARSELLIFMTPYVLDDAETAQAEALRRKKTLSDPRPWDDGGWSASALADPVSKKEQLRRFNDEWKKQDEERKAKLAIEKAKMDRAKKLEKMSEDERKFWLELHKDELEAEKRKEFLKYAQEQADLKSFLDDLKKKDLERAEAAIKKAEDEMKSESKPAPEAPAASAPASAAEASEAAKESAASAPAAPKAASSAGQSGGFFSDLKSEEGKK